MTYLSFELPEATNSFVIPDIDRLMYKLHDVSELEMENIPEDLQKAVNKLLDTTHFSFNREIVSNCFVSYSQTDYAVVFNTTASVQALSQVLASGLNLDITVNGTECVIAGKKLRAEHFGNFLCVSTLPVQPKEIDRKFYYGNSDYIVFNKQYPGGLRHILSKKYHYRLWQEETETVKGRPVSHAVYFESAPATFDQLVFYGSNRIQEDREVFFTSNVKESFDWMNDGLIYIRKDSFEIILARQGSNRDLNLILEEQTLNILSDEPQLSFFNIGKFKVMPFQTTFDWSESINELEDELGFYTEYMNFNVLTNSIPAMRWYLSQVQLGNLVGDHGMIHGVYTDCLPDKAHYVRMEKVESGGYFCQSEVYEKNDSKLITEVFTAEQKVSVSGVEVVYDFQVNIVPDRLTAIRDKKINGILLNNEKQLSMYANSGEQLWTLQLSTPLVEDPQVVDFDKDGIYEYVFFQSNQIDVVNEEGKSIPGFPLMLGGRSQAGLAVNYDNLYNYRLIVNVDNTVKVYSEQGKIVEGWMFEGMNAAIKGKIYHVLTNGKDIITFKDQSNQQYVLNRRGERRIQENIRFSLPNETDFIVGGMQSALRKMGYKGGYIYNYYVLDGERDSLKIDQPVNPTAIYWEYNEGQPLLIVEEINRLLIVNQFGYVQSEVLKPTNTNQFVGLVGSKDYGFVFADYSQNTIYLLNNYGKMILPNAVKGSDVSIIEKDLLYTYSGTSLKAYKIVK